MTSGTISIRDKKSLALASDMVRDGEFADSDVVFDKARQAVTLIFWKHEAETSGTSLSEGKNWYNFPMRRYELILTSVHAVKAEKVAAGEGKHPIGGLRFDQRGTVFLDTYDGITIEFSVKLLDGMLSQTDEIRKLTT